MLHALKKTNKVMLAIVAVAVAVTTSAGTAFALSTLSVGTFTDRQHFATNDTAYTVPASVGSGVWVNVPGMGQSITIPSGTSRLIDARFTAESQCLGGSWCSARIIIVNSAGTVMELYPQSGTDYAFDSPSDNWEGHALERNSRTFLPAGNYRVIVQAAKIGSVSTYRLDDMHFTVEQVRP